MYTNKNVQITETILQRLQIWDYQTKIVKKVYLLGPFLKKSDETILKYQFYARITSLLPFKHTMKNFYQQMKVIIF